MKENIKEVVIIPEELEIKINGGNITIKSDKNEITKKFNLDGIKIKLENNKITLESAKATKREKKRIYTLRAHLNNMIKGLQKSFEYRLEVAYSHFPMNIEYDKSKNRLIIKNFLGEKKNRVAELAQNVEVTIEGNSIVIRSHDKELAGQTAATIEKTTSVKNKDRRKFQDGIYITEKPGRNF